VVLLPDGEDPDSYSRKVGTTEFQKYLATQTQDFISFKSGLYAADAGNDPIRKAESIKEIVNSIALIPDPVKRSVYLQETSHQLKIGEQVLLAELNKLLVQERRKREREAPTQIPPEFDSALEQIQDTAAQAVDPRDMVYYQERETIRLLLNYAGHMVDEHSLVEFLLPELEDVEFSNPVFREIHDQFALQLKKGKVPDSRHFMENGSPEVRKAIAELMTDRYETSPHWKEKYHIFFPEEEEILKDMAFTNVLRFKFRVVQKMIGENLAKLRTSEQKGDWPEVEKCLEHQEGLKVAERDLAKMLGIVVAR
jgi:DNA primase